MELVEETICFLDAALRRLKRTPLPLKKYIITWKAKYFDDAEAGAKVPTSLCENPKVIDSMRNQRFCEKRFLVGI